MHCLTVLQKRLAAWLCLAMMLFAQGAYAMQACVAVAAAVEEMPCHQQQEQGGKNLCQNHCLASQQTLDAGKLPVVTPAAVPVLVVPLMFAGASTQPADRCGGIALHPGAPPIPIAYCRLLF
jgi:hypothetical protein